MIHFKCEHCSESVRVGDTHAGKSGRCPFCRGVVRIPEQSTRRPGLTGHTGQEAEQASASDVPPPPTEADRRDLEDDMNLVEIAKDPASETDIIPAEHDNGPENQDELDVANSREPQEQLPSPADQALPKPVPGVKARPKGKRRQPLKFLLWAWAVLAALAVLLLLAHIVANR